MRTAAIKRSEIALIVRGVLRNLKQEKSPEVEPIEQRLKELIESVYSLHNLEGKRLTLNQSRPLVKFVISRLFINLD